MEACHGELSRAVPPGVQRYVGRVTEKRKKKKKRLINGLQMFFNVDLLKYDLMKAWVVTHYYYSQMVQKQCYNVD